MTTKNIEGPKSVYGLLNEGYIRFERFLGMLDPIAVIERQYLVADPSDPLSPDAVFSNDHNALEFFSAGVRVIAAHFGCVSQFFSTATIYDHHHDTVEVRKIHYYGIRILPRTNQTAEDYYGNLPCYANSIRR